MVKIASRRRNARLLPLVVLLAGMRGAQAQPGDSAANTPSPPSREELLLQRQHLCESSIAEKAYEETQERRRAKAEAIRKELSALEVLNIERTQAAEEAAVQFNHDLHKASWDLVRAGVTLLRDGVLGKSTNLLEKAVKTRTRLASAALSSLDRASDAATKLKWERVARTHCKILDHLQSVLVGAGTIETLFAAQDAEALLRDADRRPVSNAPGQSKLGALEDGLATAVGGISAGLDGLRHTRAIVERDSAPTLLESIVPDPHVLRGQEWLEATSTFLSLLETGISVEQYGEAWIDASENVAERYIAKDALLKDQASVRLAIGSFERMRQGQEAEERKHILRVKTRQTAREDYTAALKAYIIDRKQVLNQDGRAYQADRARYVAAGGKDEGMAKELNDREAMLEERKAEIEAEKLALMPPEEGQK